MKAILIKVNFETGERAGGCCPNDRNLHGHPSWQCTEQGLEIRIVKDGDVEQYRGVDGIQVIDGEDEIRAAVNEHFSDREPQYRVVSDALVVESIRQLGIDLSTLPQEPVAMLRGLHESGVRGISKTVLSPVDPTGLVR